MQEDCRKCQACCKELTIVTRSRQPAKLEVAFYQARGEKTYFDEDGYLNVVLKNRECEQLTEFGCKIYDERPLYCKIFTGKDDPELKETCKYET